MQNVLPLIFPETVNRFTQVHAAWLSDTEQQTLIKLAIDVLELRHQPG
ncbi:MAG: DNA repair protein RadC, partial [Chloroflexi bacterium]|nr:DNA repair protein RadC [Chloroflexota bacterium]